MVCLAVPSREELQAFLVGSLSDEQSAEMIERIERHPASREILDELSSGDAILTARLKEALPVAPYSREPELHGALARAAQAFGNADTLNDPSAAAGFAHPSREFAVELTSGAAPPLEYLREYRLLEKLGEGGMGAVYKALHTRLDKVVALKILPADRMKHPQSVARFSREMKAVGRLDHPNIVRATDAGEFASTHFLVMEYVAGQDLSRLQQQHAQSRVADACEVVRQAAVGLQHAHEHGLVHRDLKPSNLILTSGTVKILDLGLARLLADDQEEASELTGSGQVMGTADYIAPEQASSTRDADIRADIYSLGCTLYKLLAGTPPFGGRSFPTLAMKLLAHVSTPPPPIEQYRQDIPAGLVAVLAKMLAKEKEQRYATPGELAAALEPFCRGADLIAMLRAPSIEPTTQGPTMVDLPEDDATGRDFDSPGPEKKPPGAGSRRRVWRLAVAAFAAMVAAVLVVRVQADRAELVIRSPDPNLQVTVNRDGQPILNMTLPMGETHVVVRTGDVEVVIVGANANAYSVSANRLALSRGQKETITIERVAALAPPAPDIASEENNRLIALWVVGHGGLLWGQNERGEGVEVRTRSELPPHLVKVTRIEFPSAPKIPMTQAKLLTALRGLTGDLGELLTHSVPLTNAGAADLVSISALARLREVGFTGGDLNEDGISQLCSLRNLERVSLANCKLDDRSVRPLLTLTKLSTLKLVGNQLTDAGLATLSRLNLHELDVQWNPDLTDEGLLRLANMPSLRRLGLDHTKVGDRGLEALLDRIPELESLRIGNTRALQKGLEIVPRFRKLRVLNVGGLPVTRPVLSALAELPELNDLQLGDGGARLLSPADIAVLATAPRLEWLSLDYDAEVTDQWVTPLESLRHLTHLSVTHTNITALGLRKLHEALPRCRIESDHGVVEPSPAP